MPLDMDNEPVMQMWGTLERLQNARHDLHALLEEVQHEINMTERRVGGPWVKTRAMPTDRRQEILDKLILDAKIHKLYRLPPPDGSRFPAVGVFVWPTDRPSPQDAFGVTLEAFDDIRFEHRVYILYVRKRNILRVLGDDSKSVETATSRIFGAYCEIATKNRLPTKMILVQPPSIELPATKVYSKQDHDLVGRQITVTRIRENKGIQVFLSGPPPGHKFLKDWKTDRESLNKANIEYLRKALEQGLQDVAYYRGHTRLRVYIGRMVLFGYKRANDGTYEFRDFNNMAHDPRTSGEIVRSIGSGRGGVDDKETAEELINNCNNHFDIFQPVDMNPNVSGLNGPSMEPLICATFNIRLNADGGRKKDIRLEVVFERLPGKKIYRPLHRRWLDTTAVNRKGQELNRRNGPLDVKVIDLEADLAYQFEIATWQLYRDTECYPIFQEFVRRITVEEIPDESHPSGVPAPNQPDTRPTVQRISYMNIPSLSVIGLIQKTKWRYWMGNTNYIFELTRYELFSVHEVSALFPEGVPVSFRGVGTLPDTRWGCAVWNTDWDHKLSQQAVAEIGNRGNWEPDVDKFFESSGGLDNCLDDDGFEELLGKIREGLDVVNRARDSAIRKKQEGAEKWPVMSFAGGPWTGTAEFDN